MKVFWKKFAHRKTDKSYGRVINIFFILIQRFWVWILDIESELSLLGCTLTPNVKLSDTCEFKFNQISIYKYQTPNEKSNDRSINYYCVLTIIFIILQFRQILHQHILIMIYTRLIIIEIGQSIREPNSLRDKPFKCDK